jgi:hypothetical protein
MLSPAPLRRGFFDLARLSAKTDQITAISAQPFPARTLQTGAMADIDKSRKYLRYATANERRAARTNDEGLKAMFLRVATQYRELAQINDPTGEATDHAERPRQLTAVKA